MISLDQIKRYFVSLRGNQTIDGIKRFLQFPYTPYAAPEEDYHVVNKKYADTYMGSLSTSLSNHTSIITSLSADIGGAGGMTSINLLDGDYHQDTTASAAVRGHIIVANATPEWDVLSIGLAAKFLRSDGTDPAWTSVGWTDIDGAAAVSTWISSVSTSLSSNMGSISTNTEYIASVSNAASTKISGSLSTWIASVSSSLGGVGGGDYVFCITNAIFWGDESTSGTWGFIPHSTDLKVFRIEGAAVVEKARFIP